MAALVRREVVPSSVLGMLVVIGVEVMFFAGLISAFTISRAGADPSVWQRPTAPLLPVVSTLVNSIALLASGLLLVVAHRQHARQLPAARQTLAVAWVLGAAFVVLQGREWAALLAEGLTIQSSGLGGFFYLIVGAHAAHAVGALGALGLAWWRLRRGTLSPGFLLGTETFWYFVVGLWPIIYLRVYF